MPQGSASRPPAMEALLMDYGGVLTTSIAVSFAAFCMETGVGPERLRDVIAAAYAAAGVGGGDMHDLVSGIETGRLAPAEFDRRLAAVLSEGLAEPVAPEGLSARLFARLKSDDRMRAAVAAARRAGVKTGLISNTWGSQPPDDIGPLFDVTLLSGREGVRKPEPEIYLMAARRLRVEPERCVFVDDLPANVEGARAVGMAGVVHKHAAVTIPKLEDLLGVPLGSG